MLRPSFRGQVLRVREDAIVSSVDRLLPEKGLEAMTVGSPIEQQALR